MISLHNRSCGFVKDVASVGIALQEKGIKSAAFHGKKLTASDKSKLVSHWRSGVIYAMVCTKAFGIGIDQPDVDIVVRIGCPLSFEDRAQELERAGQDGRQATGIAAICTCTIKTVFWLISILTIKLGIPCT